MSKRPRQQATRRSPRADAQLASEHLQAIRDAVGRALTAEAQAFPVPLTAPQVLALERLVESTRATGAGLSLSELSSRMGLAHSTVSGIVMRLEQRGLVRRDTRPDDRRFLSIELTEPVVDWLANELPAARVRPLEAAMRAATKTERAVILEGLSTLHRLLNGP